MKAITWCLSLAVVMFVAAGVAGLPPARAGAITSRTWTGLGGDANWSTGANWLGGTAPVGGEDLVFPDAVLQKTNSDDLPAGTVFNSISFTGPASGYSISGNGIALSSGLNASNKGYNFVYLPVTLTASQTFTISGNRLAIYGLVDLGSNVLTLAGPGNSDIIEVRGGVTGSGGISSSMAFAYVSDVNATYSGPTNVTGGTFTLSGADLDPASVVTVSAGVLQIVNGYSAGQVTIQAGA
jgi:hypothetical protein